jgi:hypothetical protein
MADKDIMLFDGIENALDYLRDIINGYTFGDLDDTTTGKEGKHAGLAQIEMARAALSVLRNNLKED